MSLDTLSVVGFYFLGIIDSATSEAGMRLLESTLLSSSLSHFSLGGEITATRRLSFENLSTTGDMALIRLIRHNSTGGEGLLPFVPRPSAAFKANWSSGTISP